MVDSDHIIQESDLNFNQKKQDNKIKKTLSKLKINPSKCLIEIMASCHSLTKV